MDKVESLRLQPAHEDQDLEMERKVSCAPNHVDATGEKLKDEMTPIAW
jgi:hypothetical protein